MKKERGILLFVVIFLVLSFSFIKTGNTTPTTIIVRVKAHDAKFIGSVVGGIKVAIKNYFNEKLLATGMIEGGTGNTKVLMNEPVIRGKVLSLGKSTAKFQFTFDIKKPQKLQIEVIGPLAAGLNTHKEIKTTWLIPGQDIKGDGILFEFYGLIVHSYSPNPHQFYPLGRKVIIGAYVTPMCGCPVRPGFLWDANKFHVKATVWLKGKIIAEIPLKWAGKISHFEGTFVPAHTGGYKIIITAYDKANNQGVDITGLVVVPPEKYKTILGK